MTSWWTRRGKDGGAGHIFRSSCHRYDHLFEGVTSGLIRIHAVGPRLTTDAGDHRMVCRAGVSQIECHRRMGNWRADKRQPYNRGKTARRPSFARPMEGRQAAALHPHRSGKLDRVMRPDRQSRGASLRLCRRNKRQI
jgi:hypothetical protein